MKGKLIYNQNWPVFNYDTKHRHILSTSIFYAYFTGLVVYGSIIDRGSSMEKISYFFCITTYYKTNLSEKGKACSF